ncbi:MAG: sodium-dependent transporter [Anaerovoracaceae bacterium]|jgi:NSS family neurotransmitter:Na+ symporter
MEESRESKGGFTGHLGFVMAAAGSAVGIGNLWRFPYLAAKDGGGLFIIIYLILVVTFGFTLLTSDIAIGRRTKQSAILAYEAISKKWKFLGVLTFLVPVVIMTYYAVIGGWVTKYAVMYFIGRGGELSSDTYFVSFITSKVSPVVYGVIFMLVTGIIVYRGVENGIEKVSKYLMPVLFLMVIGIAIFALTIRHEENGTVRTGMQGLKYYLTVHTEGLTVVRFLRILLDAMSQLFFSLSVSMGIMITYGSYVKDDVDLNKAVNQIEICDTAVAFLAGVMIIPSIYVYQGVKGMSGGTSLLFVSLPKVFDSMGMIGNIVGAVFFLMVIFATLTSCISVLEAITANVMVLTHKSRKKVSAVLTVIYIIATAVIALGYSVFYMEIKLPTGAVGQLLDLMDYISNSFMMPFIALLSCILIGWIAGPDFVTDEMERSGAIMHRKRMYRVMVKYIAPVMMAVLFLTSTGIIH